METQANDTPAVPDELSTLKHRADMLGLQYHPSIGADKLREKIAAALADKPAETPATDTSAAAAASPTEQKIVAAQETESQRRARLKREANELIRINVMCMNPAKKEWDGEIITTGNSVVGTFKKFIPFNTADGWHVPRIIYEQLKARECQVFVVRKNPNGTKSRHGKLIKEFSIDVLDALTPAELSELARRQALAAAGA